MRKIVIGIVLLLAALLVSCAPPAEEGTGPEITVYRSPT